MADYRIPGPIRNERQPWSLDDGTTTRRLMPSPGVICGESPLYPTLETRALLNPKGEPDLNFLFTQCRNPVVGLTEADFKNAADSLNVEIAAIKAVADVETRGKAFDENGRPRILFERHYFSRLTSGIYSKTHPRISNATAGGYGKFSVQYEKLEEAYKLDPEAALKSASWGRFQIMGSNYKSAGFDSVKDFVLAMTKAESEHLKAFKNFVASNRRMLLALQKKDWSSFAAAYNGPKYKENDYDQKMEEAYNRYKPAQGVAPPKKPEISAG